VGGRKSGISEVFFKILSLLKKGVYMI